MSAISQKEEKNLQNLFCPALDAELVLSVLHDLQDYDKAVELLGTLCAESPPDISDPISASAFAHKSDVVTFRQPEEDTLRVALMFDDRNNDFLFPGDICMDRDLAEKLGNVHVNVRAGQPSRSNIDGLDGGMHQSQGGCLNERGNLFGSREQTQESFHTRSSHVESSQCGTKRITDVEATDALEFAKACFPSKSKEEIALLLYDCNHDVDHLVTSLLDGTAPNQNLPSEEETNIPGKDLQKYTKDTHGRLENKYHCNIPTDTASSANNFSDAGSTTSGSVFSTNRSVSSSTTNSTTFNSSSDSGSEEKDEDWRLDMLVHMLPHIPRSEILIMLDECGGDISHAASRLMPADREDDSEERTSKELLAPSPNPGTAHQRLGDSNRDFDASLVQLASVFPDLSIDGLRRHLELTNGNREQAVDMVLALNFSGQGSSNGTENEKSGGKKRRKRTVRGRAVRSQIITVAGATSVPCSPTSGITGSAWDNHPTGFTDDPAECRKRASRLYEERKELMKRAASAHRSGNGTGIGKGQALASYYSEEGHRRGVLAKKWDERAAMATIRQELTSSSDSLTVDLHGLRVSEAVPLSQQLVEKWYKNVSSEGKTKKHAARTNPYTIICGKGIHSQGGIPRLFPAISKSLIENGWDVSLETRGCVIVRGRRTRSEVE